MPFASHILVPTDFSDASKLAVKAAGVLANQLGARVTLAHIHDPRALGAPANLAMGPDRRHELDMQIDGEIDASLAKLRDEAFADLANVDTVVLHAASAAEAICKHAEKIGADLIVIATHGRTGLKHLLIGSVTERVVRFSSVPVLTLRSSLPD